MTHYLKTKQQTNPAGNWINTATQKMKKIMLLMLAIVSLVLASCGGGGSLKPADPEIYYASLDKTDVKYLGRVDIEGCLKIKKALINETGSNSISVTVDVEMVKEPSEPISGTVAADIQVLDKNGGVIVEITGWDSNNATFKGKESVGTFTGEIKTNEGMPASKVVKNARFVRLTDVMAWKKEK